MLITRKGKYLPAPIAHVLALVGLFTAGLTADTIDWPFKYDPNTPPYSFREYNQRFTQDLLPPPTQPGATFYVSAHGNINAAGTEGQPFGSLEAARDAIRKLKQTTGLPAGGIHVIIQNGIYHRTRAFVLSEEDSGTRESPIVYRGVNKDAVVVTGGHPIDLTGITKVRDRKELKRLKPIARGKVMALKLTPEAQRYFPGEGNYGMISLDGHLLTLAQWPNRGYHHIDKILDKGPWTRFLKPGESPPPYSKENPSGGKFTTIEPLSPMVEEEFNRTGDMRVQGYLHNDWYFQDEPVGRIKDGVIQLLHHTRYGIEAKIKSIPRRVRLVNVLAELDEPGEWYFDRTEGKLYFWPIKGFDPKRSKLFALGSVSSGNASNLHQGDDAPPAHDALVVMKGTSFVTIENMTFENTGKQAVVIQGGEHNLLGGCTVRNGLKRGVSIIGGSRNGITGCDFYNLDTAFSITGGDVRSITRCYNFATNNEIHSCRKRGYGVIGLEGVGIYFAHNVLHDMNGAVMFKGVDTLIEFNEFYNIGYEMGDFNVAYCGALWYTMNNVIRYNFVHHLIEPGGHPVMGFRNDDNGAGLKIFGNVFYRPGRGSAQFDGPLNDFVNNITIDAYCAWWTHKKPIDPEGIRKSWERLSRFGTELPHGDKGDNIYIMEKILGEKGWLKSPWIDEFPELSKMLEVNPFAQTFGQVHHNYMHKVRKPFHIHGGSGTVEGMESKEVGRFVDLPKEGRFELPQEIPIEAFVSVPFLDFNFKRGFKPMEGFKPIPFDDIGFVQDRFRPDPPDKRAYRSRVFRKFLNDKGGRYDPKRVNARYPDPSYAR